MYIKIHVHFYNIKIKWQKKTKQKKTERAHCDMHISFIFYRFVSLTILFAFVVIILWRETMYSLSHENILLLLLKIFTT